MSDMSVNTLCVAWHEDITHTVMNAGQGNTEEGDDDDDDDDDGGRSGADGL